MKSFLECVGLELCEKGRKAFHGERSFGDLLPEITKASLELMHKSMTTSDIRDSLAEIAKSTAWDFEETLTKAIEGIEKVQKVAFKEKLIAYLSTFPASIRQVLRRPSDPEGHTTPDKLEFYKGEELLPFFPPRIPKFQPGGQPDGLDTWEINTLRGLGECSEVWEAYDSKDSTNTPVALKFAIDTESADKMKSSKKLFEEAFSLNEIHGIVPLRTVYTETSPPCLEYGFVPGYDLTSLINDWKWKYDSPKPEAALKLMRRLTAIVAKAHQKNVVHRDLKPSNVLLYPSQDGKFTMWITDYGWGQIESARSIELARGGTPRGEQLRLSYRGAHSPLYASPQQQKRDRAELRDDVHALGVIWYQLLKRDPHAPPPVGSEWAEPFEEYGLTETQQRLLTSCVSLRPDKRPASAIELADALQNVTVGKPVEPDGSKLISLKANTTKTAPVLSALISVRGQRLKAGNASDSAANAAASLLKADWGSGPMAAKSGEMPKFMRNSIGMAFVMVPPGTYEMGAFDDEAGRKDSEVPSHTVKINRGFYISTHLVTQAQYEMVMDKNPSTYTKSKGGSPDHPVETVTWTDAEKFCAKLGKVHEEDAQHRRYRLPFEVEWEYACRGGTQTPYYTGHKLSDSDAVFGGGKAKPQPVGRFPANPLGMYDCHGNVAEWCLDWFDEYYYIESPAVDPHGPKQGVMKVTRGGSYGSNMFECRSAARTPQHPERAQSTVGFRIVLMVNQ